MLEQLYKLVLDVRTPATPCSALNVNDGATNDLRGIRRGLCAPVPADAAIATAGVGEPGQRWPQCTQTQQQWSQSVLDTPNAQQLFVPSSVTRKSSFLCVFPSCCDAWHAALQPLDVGDDGDYCMDEVLESKDLQRVWEGVENAGSSHQVGGTKNQRRPARRHRSVLVGKKTRSWTLHLTEWRPSRNGSQMQHKQTSCSLRKLTS